MQNKKILIVSEYFYPEEFKINDIAFFWKRKGYDVGVLTSTPNYPLGKVYDGYKNKIFYKETYKGVNIYRVRTVTGYANSKIWKILKFINFMILGSVFGLFIGKKYDYVFGFNVGALTDMVPAVIISKLYRKPLMFWIQDIWPDALYAYGFKKNKILSFFLDTFVKIMYNSANHIAISGKGFKSKLQYYIKKNIEYHYLPNWAEDLNINSEAVKLSKDFRIHFTFAGNLGTSQNLENIIQAFSVLPPQYQEKSQLNIIGEGTNLKNLKILAKNNQKIIFYGKQSQDNMAKYYKASDFLIVSLRDEPIFSITVPSKIQTCIAAKKPILGIIKGDTADIIRENNLGLCANPSDTKSITKVLIECIIMSKSERNKFIDDRQTLLSTIFNKEKIINDMTNILTK